MNQPRDPSLIAKYFKEYARRGFRAMYQRQAAIAQSKIYSKEPRAGAKSRSGALMEALQHPKFHISEGFAGIEAVAYYPTYIRFLDMKRLGNKRIYNKPVWTAIFKQIVRDARYEFDDWLAAYTKSQLEQAFNPTK